MKKEQIKTVGFQEAKQRFPENAQKRTAQKWSPHRFRCKHFENFTINCYSFLTNNKNWRPIFTVLLNRLNHYAQNSKNWSDVLAIFKFEIPVRIYENIWLYSVPKNLFLNTSA